MGKSGVLQKVEGGMEGTLITCLADNILSPLGATSDDNFAAVSEGRSMLRRHDGAFGLPEPFCASLFDREMIRGLAQTYVRGFESYTFFETLCILSAMKALESCSVDSAADDVLFVFSTTKGNVDCLSASLDDSRCYLADSALRVARYFGNTVTPLVVSNACVSGVCAQIAAVRSLLAGRCRHAVVVGCDVLSGFIVSGFQSFKALSPEPCRPYDIDRVGLNLGEAAATMVLAAADSRSDHKWYYAASSNHNDANHISGPSRTGEGAYRVLSDILRSVSREEIAFVNAHGTATAYNDEMESIALHRAGLDDIPVNGLKGFYGHTLGAAGVAETILSMKAIDCGVVLPTKGYSAQGTTYALSISPDVRPVSRRSFIKILSGFGGSNAGIAYRKGGDA